jgi:putative PEP-CTERM system integral membrane protein
MQDSLNTLASLQAYVDVYLTSSPYRGEAAARVGLASLDNRQITYLGGQNAAELLQQFFALRSDEAYDAILVLTDGSGFKLGGEAIPLPAPDAPVWMVHLDGKYPLGYDDATLQAMQASGGGVAGSIEDALARLAFSLSQNQPASSDSSADWVDGYEWVTYPAGKAPAVGEAVVAHSADDPFAALAARRLILDAMQRQRGQLDDVATLDHLHEIAADQGIVTPYSSMIVLVNERQEELLKELEQKGDRFQREAEAVGETVSPFQVTGVPEPHEWLLLGLAALMLGWYAARRRG